MAINGRTFDWESIRVDAPWGLDAEIKAISYSTERPVEAVFGRGNAPNGFGRGNLEQEGSIEMDHRAWLALIAFSLTEGGLFRGSPFPITVSYSNDDQTPQVDFLPSVLIMQTETEANQGDTQIKNHTLTMKILDPIRFVGVPVL